MLACEAAHRGGDQGVGGASVEAPPQEGCERMKYSVEVYIPQGAEYPE
jgi:hypothetical protein